MKISAWFTPSASANFAWVICRALLPEHADYFRDDWVRDRYFNVVVSWHAQQTARQLNCNAEMYALESRVTRSINGRAAHFDIPKWRDPLQPQLPYRISAQAAAYAPWSSRSILFNHSCARYRLNASAARSSAVRPWLAAKLLSLCQKIVGGCRGCCPRLPWQHALIIAWSAVGVVPPALFCQNRLPSTINPC